MYMLHCRKCLKDVQNTKFVKIGRHEIYCIKCGKVELMYQIESFLREARLSKKVKFEKNYVKCLNVILDLYEQLKLLENEYPLIEKGKTKKLEEEIMLERI